MHFGFGLAPTVIRATNTVLVPADLSWLSDTGVTSSGGLVSQWDAATGSGSPTATLTARPTLTASVFGTASGITFNGTANILRATSKLVSATSAGTLGIVFKTGTSVAGPFVLFAQSDSAATNRWWEFGIASDGRLYIEYNNTGTKTTLKGTTVLDASTVYYSTLSYDGTDFYLELNGTEENPLHVENAGGSFVWAGAVTGTVHTAIGAGYSSGGAARFFNGNIGGIYFWNSDLTA